MPLTFFEPDAAWPDRPDEVEGPTASIGLLCLPELDDSDVLAFLLVPEVEASTKLSVLDDFELAFSAF
jgi:hypothetical protein